MNIIPAHRRLRLPVRSLAAVPALLAAAGMAVPAQAAPVPVIAHGPAAGDLATLAQANVAGWDRYRRYRPYRHRRRGADAGDIIAGVLVLGGALAVANAIKNKREREREDYPAETYPRDDRYRAYPDRSYQDRGGEGRRGIEGAIDQCVSQVERTAEVDTVDDASRGGTGWHIAGDLYGGGRFTCEIDNTGRIRTLDIEGDRQDWSDAGREWGSRDGNASYGEGRDAGYSDDYYASARARQGMGAPEDQASEAGWSTAAGDGHWADEEPDYNAGTGAGTAMDDTPAGEQDWQRGESDDRYNTSSGPTTVALAQ